MFEGLKKKLADAVKGFVKKDEKEIKEEAKKETQEAQLAAVQAAVIKEEQPVPPPVVITNPEPVQPAKEPEKHNAKEEAAVLVHINKAPHPAPPEKPKIHEEPRPRAHVAPAKEIPPQPQAPHRATEPPAPLVAPERHEEKKREESPDIVKLSLKTKLKSVFIRTVLLNEREIEDFTENVRISLLESDVSYDTAEAFIDSLKGHLSETKIDSKNIQGALLEQVRLSLFDILSKSGKGVDIPGFVSERVSQGKLPVKILFLGPNGTGKTTTIAKLAYGFKKRGTGVVLSASDTFRAAAIEQTEHHANKVGVPVIKSTYGADPASIAFDAIAYARAHNHPVVLIDSAGRQETNKNLINEMQKIVRVASPDLVVFVGESTAGNALSEQIKEFSKFIKIDGIILTKLDVDAKGGNAISIAYTTGIPILFIGTGESYDALIPYTPEFIVNAIIPNN